MNNQTTTTYEQSWQRVYDTVQPKYSLTAAQLEHVMAHYDATLDLVFDTNIIDWQYSGQNTLTIWYAYGRKIVYIAAGDGTSEFKFNVDNGDYAIVIGENLYIADSLS